MKSTLNHPHGRATLGILVGAWLSLVVPVAEAQEMDSRWAPWLGCWQAVDEAASAPLLCVVPLAGAAAVEMLTVVDGQVVSRESIFADGQQHAVSREGCEGWERSEFSGDARRVYIRSDLNCGAGVLRSSTGVLSMVSPFEWLDVRTMDVDGQSVPWVVRYRLASRADLQAAGQGNLIGAQDADARMARMAASVPLDLDDVIEATGKVSAETVQVWVLERAEPFALDATRLIGMADAGVPPSVIDVVVAVSYPEKFVINEGSPSGRRTAEAARRPGSPGLGFGRTLNPFEDPFYDPYSRYGYSSRYGFGSRYGLGYFGYGPGSYGAFGYGYGGYGGYGLGGYNYGFGGYGTPIVVVGRRGMAADSGPTAGRVVRGGGYTSAGRSGGSTGRIARPRSSGSGSGAAAPSATPARRSTSSSPQATGRRAQPRPRAGN